MFSSKTNTPTEKSTQKNVLGQGTEVKGDIITHGPFRIDGVIKGNLTSNGKVVVGKTGVIEGNLECENADFEGELTGGLFLTGTLSLKSTAKIHGDVKASKLIVEPGAIFNANCNMNTGIKTPTNNVTVPVQPKKRKKTEQTV